MRPRKIRKWMDEHTKKPGWCPTFLAHLRIRAMPPVVIPGASAIFV